MVIDKDNIKILLFILIIGFGLGYAYINSDLNINGTARVDHANWDVHWANIAITTGSVSGTNVVTQPTISNQTTVNYSIILSKPGDYYEFTVDAVNGGTIDAMIDTISSKLNGTEITTLPDYLNYEVSYFSGVELEPNHGLLANSTEKYKVRLEYRTDINPIQLPTSNQTLNLQFTVTYRQMTADAIPVSHVMTRYTANNISYVDDENYVVSIGSPMPNNIQKYKTAEEALAALLFTCNNYSGINFYLKHTIDSNIVTESYVEFIVTQEMANSNPTMVPGTYALRGLDTYDPIVEDCKLEEYFNSSTYNCESPYYESNKGVLLSAFGSSKCTVGTSETSCCAGKYKAYLDGSVKIWTVGGECTVDNTGKSYCSGNGMI